MRILITWILLSVLFIAAGPSEAGCDIRFTDSRPFDLVDVSPDGLNVSPEEIEIAGEYMFVAGGITGFHLIDISDPANPDYKGKLDIPYWVDNFEISDGYAYLSVGGYFDEIPGSIVVIDIDPPLDMHVEARLELDLPPNDIAIKDSYLLMNSGYSSDVGSEHEFLTIDISNPTAPTIVARQETDINGFELFVNGDYMYAEGWGYGIQLYDISDVMEIRKVHVVEFDEYIQDLAVSDNYAFGIRWLPVYSDCDVIGEFSIEVVDISNPADSEIIASLGFDTWIREIQVGQDFLVVVDWAGLMYVVDVSDESNPNIVTDLDILGYAMDIKIVDSMVYLAGANGIHIIDCSSPDNPVKLSRMLMCGDISTVKVSGDFAIGYSRIGPVESGYGVTIFNITNPEATSIIDTLEPNHGASCGAIDENIIYIGGKDYVTVYEIDNYDIAELGKFEVNGVVDDIRVVDSEIYVASSSGDYPGEYHLTALSSTADGYLTRSVIKLSGITGPVSQISHANGYVFLASSWAEFKVVDVRSPDEIVEIESIEHDGAVMESITSGNYLYAACHGNGVQIFNIRDIETISRIGYLEQPVAWTGSIEKQGNFIFVTGDWNGLMVLDVSDPEYITQVAQLETNGWASDVAVKDNYAFVASGTGGLRIIRLR